MLNLLGTELTARNLNLRNPWFSPEVYPLELNGLGWGQFFPLSFSNQHNPFITRGQPGHSFRKILARLGGKPFLQVFPQGLWASYPGSHPQTFGAILGLGPQQPKRVGRPAGPRQVGFSAQRGGQFFPQGRFSPTGQGTLGTGGPGLFIWPTPHFLFKGLSPRAGHYGGARTFHTLGDRDLRGPAPALFVPLYLGGTPLPLPRGGTKPHRDEPDRFPWGGRLYGTLPLGDHLTDLFQRVAQRNRVFGPPTAPYTTGTPSLLLAERTSSRADGGYTTSSSFTSARTPFSDFLGALFTAHLHPWQGLPTPTTGFYLRNVGASTLTTTPPRFTPTHRAARTGPPHTPSSPASTATAYPPRRHGYPFMSFFHVPRLLRTTPHLGSAPWATPSLPPAQARLLSQPTRRRPLAWEARSQDARTPWAPADQHSQPPTQCVDTRYAP